MPDGVGRKLMNGEHHIAGVALRQARRNSEGQHRLPQEVQRARVERLVQDRGLGAWLCHLCIGRGRVGWRDR